MVAGEEIADENDEDEEEEVEAFQPDQAGGVALVQHLMTVIDAVPA